MECAKCHRPIESGAYTLLPDNSTAFHRQCFTCAICDLELPVQYVSVDNRFMHQQCYVDKLAARCLKCHMPTAPDEVVFNLSPSSSSAAAESKVIHQRCFVCAKCGRALDGKYFERDEAFYDGGCYTELFAPRCGRCGKAIATSQPFQKFQSSSFHSEVLYKLLFFGDRVFSLTLNASVLHALLVIARWPGCGSNLCLLASQSLNVSIVCWPRRRRRLLCLKWRREILPVHPHLLRLFQPIRRQ
eukprot:Partr_v1_DN27344_c1_g1_i3_m45917 putative four and A half lim domains